MASLFELLKLPEVDITRRYWNSRANAIALGHIMKYVWLVATSSPLLRFYSPRKQVLLQETQHCAVTILTKVAKFTAQ